MSTQSLAAEPKPVPLAKAPSAPVPPSQSEQRFTPREFSMLFALIAIWAFFAAVVPNFVSSRNLSNLAVELSITAVLALGMFLVILCGQIDLSIGSGVGLLGGVAAVLVFQHGWSAPAAMLLTLVIGVGVWAGMGAFIVSQKIPSFIVTLAGLMAFKGLHWQVIHDATIPVTVGGVDNLYSLLTTWYLPPAASCVLGCCVFAIAAIGQARYRARRKALGLGNVPRDIAFSKLFIAGQAILLFVLVCNQFRGIPLPALILATVAGAIWTVTQHTRFGRYLYAIGGNEEAALISGVPVGKVVIGAFAIMGAIVALGGFLQTAYAGASTTTTGDLLELDAIAACVIGGTSLKGGRGSVSGVIFGSLIMASLINGMTLMAVSPETKYVARGLVLALAVWLDARLSSRR